MKSLWPLIKVVVGAGILVTLIVRLGAQAFVDGLAAIGAGSVLAALGLGLLTTVASAARWCLVARGLGLRLPLPAAVSDCYRAVFLNSVLPAGVLGDVHRAVGYGRQTVDERLRAQPHGECDEDAGADHHLDQRPQVLHDELS